MARMIPNVDALTIENNGENLFYQAAASLPNNYTVLYSYKYKTDELANTPDTIREADFVIVHPALGYLVIEVKQGEIAYNNGAWYEYKSGDYRPLRKNPVEQAESAMYAILRLFKQKAKTDHFPLKIKYTIGFPECQQISGELPASLDKNSIFLHSDLDNLENKILSIFNIREKKEKRRATDILLNKVLAPAFKVFARLDAQIEMFRGR